MTTMAAIIWSAQTAIIRRHSDGDQVAIMAAIRRRSGGGQVTIIHCSDQAAIGHEPTTRRRAGGNQAAIRQQSGQ